MGGGNSARLGQAVLEHLTLLAFPLPHLWELLDLQAPPQTADSMRERNQQSNKCKATSASDVFGMRASLIGAVGGRVSCMMQSMVVVHTRQTYLCNLFDVDDILGIVRIRIDNLCAACNLCVPGIHHSFQGINAKREQTSARNHRSIPATAAPPAWPAYLQQDPSGWEGLALCLTP